MPITNWQHLEPILLTFFLSRHHACPSELLQSSFWSTLNVWPSIESKLWLLIDTCPILNLQKQIRVMWLPWLKTTIWKPFDIARCICNVDRFVMIAKHWFNTIDVGLNYLLFLVKCQMVIDSFFNSEATFCIDFFLCVAPIPCLPLCHSDCMKLSFQCCLLFEKIMSANHFGLLILTSGSNWIFNWPLTLHCL